VCVYSSFVVALALLKRRCFVPCQVSGGSDLDRVKNVAKLSILIVLNFTID